MHIKQILNATLFIFLNYFLKVMSIFSNILSELQHRVCYLTLLMTVFVCVCVIMDMTCSFTEPKTEHLSFCLPLSLSFFSLSRSIYPSIHHVLSDSIYLKHTLIHTLSHFTFCPRCPSYCSGSGAAGAVRICSISLSPSLSLF